MPTPHAWDCRCGTRNALTFAACRHCGAGRSIGRQAAELSCSLCGARVPFGMASCPGCGQRASRPAATPQSPAAAPRPPTPPRPPAPPPANPGAWPSQPPPPAAAPQQTYNPAYLWALLVTLLPAALWYLPKSIGGSTSSYEVHVRTSSPGMRYSGLLGTININGGGSSDRSVDGVGAATSNLDTGQTAAAVFQKHGEGGSLTLELWRDGNRLKTESTSADYGCVSVSD